MEQIRLQKFFTDNGIMSRRATEAEILAGKVRVNGQVAVMGQKIDPETDVVSYRGKIIRPRAQAKTYIMLNKPLGYVTSLSDEKGRACVTELVAGVGRRVYPIGRLDMYSEGLLLFTDDGELTNRLTHPRHNIPKIYNVKVRGEVGDDTLAVLRSPMEIDGYRIRPVKVHRISMRDGSTNLEFSLTEGRNRQIRKMCEIAGLTIMKLTRVAIGRLKLGDLPMGKWRALTAAEVDYLYGRKESPYADRDAGTN